MEYISSVPYHQGVRESVRGHVNGGYVTVVVTRGHSGVYTTYIGWNIPLTPYIGSNYVLS